MHRLLADARPFFLQGPSRLPSIASRGFQIWRKNEELGVLPSVVDETEKSVQVHVRRAFQKKLLQRVLEIGDSFVRSLQKVILED